MESGQELCSDVCAADELVRQRVSKIVAVSDSVSRDTACENVQDMQATFNTLFVNVCNVCSDMSIEQSIQITRHIMANNSAQVVAAVTATPLSTAASRSLKRFAHMARATLQLD
jgi:hypothetical protein